jgi:tetratricopeptide (TPR) repeat protein
MLISVITPVITSHHHCLPDALMNKPELIPDPLPVRQTSKSRHHSKNKDILFKVISIFIPFLVLGILELSLRFFHYGQDMSLFIESPADPGYLVFNPGASGKYFSNQEIATTGNIEPFRKKKEANTLRIFVLGESTTIGYPYFHNGSFHRWLQYRLMHTFPEKNFEIINLSLTAVNSYTVLGFARELVRYEPDAILIYSGHNEYYGAMGVGSTERIGGNPNIVNGLLALRKLRLVQLMTHAYEGIARLFGQHPAGPGKTRMELMVADQEIPFQSLQFNRGIDQFRSNMEETLHLFDKAHIPVFISNLVSNEKDLKPFISIPVDSIRFPAFTKNYALGLKAMESGDQQAARGFFSEAVRVYDKHALCNYYLGRLAWQQGDFGQAKIYFSRAKDLDALRFRAPDSINAVIRQLCQKYENVHLVDAKKVFESHSDNYIPGDALLIDHVHPNLAGYALLSDAFYEEMKKQSLFSINKVKEITFQQLLQTMPITQVDSLTGVDKIFNLKRNWPFKMATGDSIPTDKEEEKLAYGIVFRQEHWQDAMRALYEYYIRNRDLAKAKIVLEGLVLEYPAEESWYEKTANICGELKDDDNALFYFKKAFSLTPSFDLARYLFVLYLKMDQPADAIPYLDYAIEHNTAGMNLGLVRHITEEILQLQRLSEKNSADLSILNQIAGKYIAMGNETGASKYIEKILRADPGNRDALSLVARLKKG